ncbi:MAG: hypothetical protein P8J29_10535 [Rhodospirillales bacterium]|nr:hypothetical protein [Rhodospirillales bacterium]
MLNYVIWMISTLKRSGLLPAGEPFKTCEATLIANLRSILPRLKAVGPTLLIKPHCSKDFPGYILAHMDQARCVVDAVGSLLIRILLDTYYS